MGCRSLQEGSSKLGQEVYTSASETDHHNQSVAQLLRSYGRIHLDPVQAA